MVPDLSPVVLWKTDTLRCVCVAHAKDRVELRFVVADVIILRKFFSDPDAASAFAIEKMHAYNAG